MRDSYYLHGHGDFQRVRMYFLLPPPKHYLVYRLLEHLLGAIPRTHHTEPPGLLHTPCPLPRSRARQTSPRRTETGGEGGVGQRGGTAERCWVPQADPLAAAFTRAWPHLAQEVPAVGPGFTLALELVAKGAGAEAVLFLLLTDAAAQRGGRAHILGVLDPVAPKLGQDDQGVRASLLHNLEAKGESCPAACPGLRGKWGGANGGIPPTSELLPQRGPPYRNPKAVA